MRERERERERERGRERERALNVQAVAHSNNLPAGEFATNSRGGRGGMQRDHEYDCDYRGYWDEVYAKPMVADREGGRV